MEKQIVTIYFSGYMDVDINKLDVIPNHPSSGTPSTPEEKLELLLDPAMATHYISFEQAYNVKEMIAIEKWEVIVDD